MDSFSIKRAILVLVLLVLGLCERLFLVSYLDESTPTSAENLYTELAENWTESLALRIGDDPTASTMPAYPILLGVQRWLLPGSWQPILWVQVLFGTLSAWLAARIAWKVYRRPVTYWATLVLLLFHPAFAAMSGKLEPLAIVTFLFLLGTWFLSSVLRPGFQILYFLAAASVFAFSLYFSLKVLLLVPILAFGFGLMTHEKLIGILGGTTICLGLLVALMPWMARNLIVLGTFVPLTTTLPCQVEASLLSGQSQAAGPIRVSTGQGELQDYQRALGRIPDAIRLLTVGDWLRFSARALTTWWSDYPLLFERVHSPPRLLPRVILFTLGITLFFLCVIGILSTLNQGRTWVLLAALLLFGLQVSFLSYPAYQHLLGFPILILLASRGIDQLSTLLSKENRSVPARTEPPNPDWDPDSSRFEFPEPSLEPIRGPHHQETDSSERKEENRLGPLF